MKRTGIIIGSIIAVSFTGCSVLPILSGNTTNTSNVKTYSEDLSVHRMEYQPLDRMIEVSDDELEELPPLADSLHYQLVNDSVNYSLDSIARIRLSDNKVTGFTILVFSSMSREESRKALGKVYQVLPDDEADLVYQQPYFRVKTGKFMHEIHAYATLKKLKEVFPSAVIVPEEYKIVEPDND